MALALPVTRDFFDLAAPGPGIVATAVCGSLLSIVALALSGFTPGSAATLAEPE